MRQSARSHLHLELGALLIGPFCGLQVSVLILPDVGDADLSGATQWSSRDLKGSEAVIPQSIQRPAAFCVDQSRHKGLGMQLCATVAVQTVCTLVEKGAKILSLTSLMRCCRAAMRALRSSTAFSSLSTPGCCFWASCGQQQDDHVNTSSVCQECRADGWVTAAMSARYLGRKRQHSGIIGHMGCQTHKLQVRTFSRAAASASIFWMRSRVAARSCV